MSPAATKKNRDGEEWARQKAEVLSLLEVVHQQIRSDDLDCDEVDELVCAAHSLVESL